MATSYEGSDRTPVTVDDEIVAAVLGQLGVDATSDDAIARELASAERTSSRFPGTIAATQGAGRDLGDGVAGTLHLEDGGTLDVQGALPADLPLGWHRLTTGDRDITVVVGPARLPEVPRTWGWMLQLYSLRSDDSWGMGDYGDLAAIARRAGGEQGAGVLLVNPVQAFVPSTPLQRSPTRPRAGASPARSTSASPTRRPSGRPPTRSAPRWPGSHRRTTPS